MQSLIEKRGPVPFPAFTGERVYMREFSKRGGLPRDLARWQSTVDAMLERVETDGPIYLMVDQGFVNKSKTHRRPGVHIDGRWVSTLGVHGGRPHHAPSPPEPPPCPKGPRHSLQARGHHGHRFDGPAELIIFASDVMACRAYVGDYEGVPAEGGDCSHIDVSKMSSVDMESGFVWLGDALATLHESVPVGFDCLRTMVRLNVPMGHQALNCLSQPQRWVRIVRRLNLNLNS